MRRSLVAIATILLAVQALAVLPVQAQTREEREVRALLDRMFQMASSTDEKLARQNLADHSRTGGPYYPPFVASLAGTAEMEAWANPSALAALSSRSLKATGPITIRADKNVAWAAYPWRAEITFKDGTRFAFEGRATVTLVREGKAWKFAHWHSSLVAPAPLTPTARQTETQAILEMERNAWEALKNKNLDALKDYYADEASRFAEGQAYRISGKENLLRELGERIGTTALRSYQIVEPQVQIWGDTALLTYYYAESGITAGQEFSRTGKITVVFVKQKGAWRALHEHYTANR